MSLQEPLSVVSSCKSVSFPWVMLSGPQDRRVLVSLWAYSGQSSLAHRKPRKVWFSRRRSVERGVSAKWTRLCYPRVPVAPLHGVSQLPCLEAEATAPTTIPNGAHSATTEPAHCTPEMGGSSKARTADLMLAVSSDHDDGLPELLMILLSMSWRATNQVWKSPKMVMKNGWQWLKRGERGLARGQMSLRKFATKWKMELQAWRSEEATQCSHGSGHL